MSSSLSNEELQARVQELETALLESQSSDDHGQTAVVTPTAIKTPSNGNPPVPEVSLIGRTRTFETAEETYVEEDGELSDGNNKDNNEQKGSQKKAQVQYNQKRVEALLASFRESTTPATLLSSTSVAASGQNQGAAGAAAAANDDDNMSTKLAQNLANAKQSLEKAKGAVLGHLVEEFMMESNLSAQGSKDAEKDRDLLECIYTMCFGVTILEADLLPLSFHRRGQLFDFQKLQTYAQTHLRDERCVRKETISGKSIQEFTKDFSATMGGDASLASALAPSAKAEVNIKYGETTKSSSTFRQERLQIYKKLLSLPMPQLRIEKTSSWSQEVDPLASQELDNLLTARAKRAIAAIGNYDTAKAFLKLNGFLYVHKIYIGGSEITRGKSSSRFLQRSTEKSTSASGGAGGPNPFSCLMSSAFRREMSESAEQSSSRWKRLGGSHMKTDQDQWKESIDDNHRAIIQCEFKPLYFLAKPGSRAEKYLKQAHSTFFAPIVGGNRYFIRNLSDATKTEGDCFELCYVRDTYRNTLCVRKRIPDVRVLFGKIGDRPVGITVSAFTLLAECVQTGLERRLDKAREAEDEDDCKRLEKEISQAMDVVLSKDQVRRLFKKEANKKFLLKPNEDQILESQDCVHCVVKEINKGTTEGLLNAISFCHGESGRIQLSQEDIKKLNARVSKSEMPPELSVQDIGQHLRSSQFDLVLDGKVQESAEKKEHVVPCKLKDEDKTIDDLLEVMQDRKVSLDIDDYEKLSSTVVLKPEELLPLVVRANYHAEAELKRYAFVSSSPRLPAGTHRFELLEKKQRNTGGVDFELKDNLVEFFVEKATLAVQSYTHIKPDPDVVLYFELERYSGRRISKEDFLKIVRAKAVENANWSTGAGWFFSITLHASDDTTDSTESNSNKKKKKKTAIVAMEYDEPSDDSNKDEKDDEDEDEKDKERNSVNVHVASSERPGAQADTGTKLILKNKRSKPVKYEVTVLTWDEDPTWRELKVALSFQQEDKKSLYVRRSGWKTLGSQKHHVKLSSKPYTKDTLSDWKLQRVQDNVFLIRSAGGQYLLGMQASSTEDGGYEPVLAKKPDDGDYEKVEAEYKWKFSWVRDYRDDVKRIFDKADAAKDKEVQDYWDDWDDSSWDDSESDDSDSSDDAEDDPAPKDDQSQSVLQADGNSAKESEIEVGAAGEPKMGAKTDAED